MFQKLKSIVAFLKKELSTGWLKQLGEIIVFTASKFAWCCTLTETHGNMKITHKENVSH